jgi:hypothetical protein
MIKLFNGFINASKKIITFKPFASQITNYGIGLFAASKSGKQPINMKQITFPGNWASWFLSPAHPTLLHKTLFLDLGPANKEDFLSNQRKSCKKK